MQKLKKIVISKFFFGKSYVILKELIIYFQDQ